MNAVGSAVSRAPVFWLTLLGATLKHSNECSCPTIKKCTLSPFYFCAALYGQLVFAEENAPSLGDKRETRPCVQWWRSKSALLCSGPMGSYHIYESPKEVAILTSFLLYKSSSWKNLCENPQLLLQCFFKYLTMSRISLALAYLNFILKINGATLT